MPRTPLPDDLPPAFPVALARSAGVGEGRLRGSDLRRPFHGVRSRAALDVEDGASAAELRRAQLIRSAQEYSQRMSPFEFFSHSTAAMIWDAALPLVDADLLHVSVLGPRRLPRARGVRGHQARPHLTRVVLHAETGLRLTSPATTWAALGAQLRHPYDLVAAGDSFVRVQRMPGPWHREMPPPLAHVRDLEAAIAAGRRVGARALREALPRVRLGAASRPESWTRLTLCDAGLPEPVLDHDVYDDDGRFIGCVDLAYPELKIAIEYEGDHHRTDPAAWNRDMEKHDALQAAGWRVIRVSRTVLFARPHELVERVREALRARG
ncbi:hypothetical protein M4I32_11125 [Microbacterium sp. LRZ72]|uniref:endonuclease domain-containing protein n=1 Tax=Microbacterium sp. LRZ72 TaxID=2942481 RepID=UPI0029B27641|nr:hypothetical protein [Microbacterium sp. LRZ72]MDX2377350.1 hypothetical protein [Microbacterium sp. LRZ72]